ncbi:MAG TPA: RES family NAD+ phosphorylase [Chitinophaga sp.]
MLIFRITLKRYAHELFAPGVSGRWNSDGKKVIYAASSVSLAIMENLVRRNGYGFNVDFAIMVIEVPDHISIVTYTLENLPPGWNDPGSYAVSQPVGDAWYDSMKTPVLKVPSAVVPQEFNCVLNSLHPDYVHIKLIAVTKFVPDKRIEEILKQHSITKR